MILKEIEMKKIHLILMIIMIFALLTVGVSATEGESAVWMETSGECEAESFTVCETVSEDGSVTEYETGSETEILIGGDVESEMVFTENEQTLSEAILAVAEELGISFEEAEALVAKAIMLGDKYLSDSDLWAAVAKDIGEHPAKWVLIAAVFLLILFLIGLLIKRVLNDAVSLQRTKIAIEGIGKTLNGDAEDDGGSIRALIGEKNAVIESLKAENGELKDEIGKLRSELSKLKTEIGGFSKNAEALTAVIGKVEANSGVSLKITEENALQILQLLNIALDRKVPITSAEARQIWYEHTQNRIKTIYEEGLGNGKSKDEQEV